MTQIRRSRRHDVKSNVSLPAILIQIGGGGREDDAKLIEGD